MAIEDMFRALEEQAEAECETIREDASAQVDAVRREAEDKATQIKARRLEEAEAVARSKASHAVNAARLANKKDVAALKGNAVSDVFEAARERLTAVRSGEGYEKLFTVLLDQALECADGECDVLVDPADVELANRIVPALGRNGISVKGEISTAGGVVVTTDDGRIIHRNTLEDRLEKAKNQAQARIAEILFG